ncbi:restriction endonuclease subunit S, partial [Sphaerotilus sp.]|uniref:restriction endonuclease subunit S n=1 Tax=Sphaerotilus sp. TaxID=2093942 RepID=UPI0034E29A67
PAIFNDEVLGACFQNTLLRFRCYDCVTPSYALKYFLHCMYSGIFQKHAQQTTNIAHLSSGRLATIDFLLPPMEEQHRIIAKVDEFVGLCDRIKSKIARAQALNERLARTLVERAVS